MRSDSSYFKIRVFLIFVICLLSVCSASPVFAFSSCEEACPVEADESGVNNFPADGGGELTCCCIQNGEDFESRPIQECENL